MNGFTTRQQTSIRGLWVAAAIQIFVPLLTILGSALVFTQNCAACPFCLSPPQTLSEQIRRADIVLIAELVSFQVYDQGTRPESILRIRTYLRGERICRVRRDMAVGQPIVIAAEATGETGDLFLMYGTLPGDCTDMLELHSAATRRNAPGTLIREPAPENQTSENTGSENAVVTGGSGARADDDDFERYLHKCVVVYPTWISWNETLAVTQQAVDYILGMPSTEKPQTERLPYFVQFLENADALVAIDAWAEFGNSKYEDVCAIRERLSIQNLRNWIADPQMSPERLGLYGMMLGLCGGPEDSQFLLDQMMPVSSSVPVPSGLGTIGFRYGGEGLMGGYLLLQGEAGLANLERLVHQKSVNSETIAHAFIQCLQFVWTYESQLISRQQVAQSMRRMLAFPSMREIAVTNLSRWEDWQALPEIQFVFEQLSDKDRSLKRAVAQYAELCLKKTPPHSEINRAAELLYCRTQAHDRDMLSLNLRDFQAPE